jgi:hypothetical protein
MFSTLHTSARAVLLTALVGGAALAVVPTAAAAQSVTPEQALLNRAQTGPGGALIAHTQGPAAAAPVEQIVIDGERALLNHSRATAGAPVDAIVSGKSVVDDAQSATGVKALLNRSSL